MTGKTPQMAAPRACPSFQCAVGVAVHENALDRDLLRAVLPHEFLDAVEDLA